MSIRRASAAWLRLALLAALTSACLGPYAERPPAGTDEASRPAAAAEPGRDDREPEAPAGDRAPRRPAADPGASADGTLVGWVTPDGRFHADTGSAAADPEPVERRTVVTGTVRTAPSVAAPLATGWRVQVYAARDEASAAEVARRLEGRLEGQLIYVEHADPWFKVRVGDFATAEEAEALRARLVGMGYAEAWVARTTIRTAR